MSFLRAYLPDFIFHPFTSSPLLPMPNARFTGLFTLPAAPGHAWAREWFLSDGSRIRFSRGELERDELRGATVYAEGNALWDRAVERRPTPRELEAVELLYSPVLDRLAPEDREAFVQERVEWGRWEARSRARAAVLVRKDRPRWERQLRILTWRVSRAVS